MHDIDSTRLETSADQNEYPEYRELGSENGGAQEGEDSLEMPMSEAEEEALAAELLGVSSEEEMDQFFGSLFRKLKRGIGGAAKLLSQHAGPLSGVLKGIAGKALPFLGGALGTAIPIPGLGTALGTTLGRAASNLLESETDHMEVEEREFQMARRFVQLASQAARQLSRTPLRANPTAAVSLAVRNAIQRMNRLGTFRSRPIYQYCPPCPPPESCPTCSQALPAADSGHSNGNGSGSNSGHHMDAGAGSASSKEFGYTNEGEAEAGGEAHFESENYGEHEAEGESYETDNEFLAGSSEGTGRGGRWVRRGRKIILYGL